VSIPEGPLGPGGGQADAKECVRASGELILNIQFISIQDFTL